MLNIVERLDKRQCKYQLIAFVLQHVIIALLFILRRSKKSVFLPILSHTPTHGSSTDTEEGMCLTPLTLTCFETRYDSKDDKKREGMMRRGQ